MELDADTAVVCGAEFARCICVLDVGHDAEIHECRQPCGGSWRVDGDGEQVPVTYPLGVSPEAAFEALLSPWWYA